MCFVWQKNKENNVAGTEKVVSPEGYEMGMETEARLCGTLNNLNLNRIVFIALLKVDYRKSVTE